MGCIPRYPTSSQTPTFPPSIPLQGDTDTLPVGLSWLLRWRSWLVEGFINKCACSAPAHVVIHPTFSLSHAAEDRFPTAHWPGPRWHFLSSRPSLVQGSLALPRFSRDPGPKGVIDWLCPVVAAPHDERCDDKRCYACSACFQRGGLTACCPIIIRQ